MRKGARVITSIISCMLMILLFAACSSCSQSGDGAGGTGTEAGGGGGTGGGAVGGGGAAVNISCASGSGAAVEKCGADFTKEAGPGYGAAAPAKGVPFADPDFGASITRLTEKGADGYAGAGIENEYARSDPENSDGTLVILRGNSGQWYLYNTATRGILKQLTIEGGGEEPEPRWDASDPKIFYFLSGSQLRSCNVTTFDATVVCDFKSVSSNVATITTKTEGDASLDRRFWCFMLEDADRHLLSVVTYDRTGNAILAGKSSGFPDALNWVSMDMSGSRCVLGYEDSDADADDKTPPVDVFDRATFAKVATLPEGSTGHMDLAKTADGKDVMVYQNNATDWIAMADLATGAETNLVAIPFNVNGDIGIHVSGNGAQKPGWALISTYGSRNVPTDCDPACTHSWMDNALFLLKLQANPPAPTMLAHTNAYTSLNFTGEKNYFAEAFAAINTRGTKVTFGSNWSDFSNIEYSDTYVLTMPSY